MHAEYFIINDSSDGEKVENFSKGSPYIQRTVLFNALIIKAIDLSDQS